MNEQKRDALAEALRGHQIKSTGLGEWTCSCTPREWRPTSTRVRHYADALLPLVDTWLAEAEQRVTDAVEAALRLIAPDHITPMGARQVRAAMENVTTRGNR